MQCQTDNTADVLVQCRWCWGVSGCMAAADGKANKSQEHTRLSVCVWSQVIRTGCVQSSTVPRADPEGVIIIYTVTCYAEVHGCCVFILFLKFLHIFETTSVQYSRIH